MKKINFLFGIHCHQPVGNFEHVFEECFSKCYEPFLNILLKHQGIRCSLHFTGPLLEWIEKQRPEYFDKIRVLVERSQVEMLTGGFYEPVLSVLPEQDAIEQIQYMSNYTRDNFNYNPKGMWLAERVWEPTLPSLLKKTGVQYSLLDDSHFLATGMNQNEMFGYYITENQGSTVRLFPISKNLRYLIPFKQPEDAISYFRSIASNDPSRAVTMGDDGEKFGVWPHTYDWVYNQGYLERLFSLLEENSSWITMLTFSEYIEQYPPQGRIYLPTSSYEEMLEWSLPARAIAMYKYTVQEMEKSKFKNEIKPFIRGGFWRNFLAKYHESNLMHKKMLWVSNLVHSCAENNLDIKKELWRGQCNCAYWHGLFGGTYLNYLRNAIYTHLINAEKQVDSIQYGENQQWSRVEQCDYMCEGRDKILISSSVLNVYIDPARSGSCFELDYKPSNFNLLNTFSRKYEAYHDKIIQSSHEDSDKQHEQPASIHDMVTSKEDGLENLLIYDRYFRQAFVDHFISPDTTIEKFVAMDYTEQGAFTIGEFRVSKVHTEQQQVGIILEATGDVMDQAESNIPVSLQKAYSLKTNNQLDLRYIINNKSKTMSLKTMFGSELNLTYLAAEDIQRYYITPSGKPEPMNTTSSLNINDYKKPVIALINEWDNISMEIAMPGANKVWRSPIETVSQSEGGFEKTYQHSVVMPLWCVDIKPSGFISLGLTIKFSSVR